MKKWTAWLNQEERSINQFIRSASASVPAGGRVLDAGSGRDQFSGYFLDQQFITTDLPDTMNRGRPRVHSSIDHLPFPHCTFDAVICTQVLEHVSDPQRVINELHRVLKPGGQLFLTAPQGWGIHNEPYHFFNFTLYGLRLLFQKAGFKIRSIQPRGGFFVYLAYRIHQGPRKILKQHKPGAKLWSEKTHAPTQNSWKYQVARVISKPIFLLLDLVASLLILIDDWDCEKRFTLGYACVVVKN